MGPAPRDPDDRETVELQLVGERGDVAGRVEQGAPLAAVGATEPGPIEGDQAHPGRHHVGSEEARARRAMEEDDWRTVGITPLAVREAPAVGEADERRVRPAHSSTSSMSVPNAVLGWMNATVVPRLPGRGASSITL